MNSNWQDFLGACGAHFEQTVVRDFGDGDGELAAARAATIASPLLHLGLIDCTGDDAQSFLHNQLTSDVSHLEPDCAQHAAWCTAKGRMLASFLLYRDQSGYRALLSADLLASTQKRLQMFVLRSKVKLTDLSATHVAIGLSGPDAPAALAGAGLSAPAEVMHSATSADALVIRIAPTRYIVVAAADAAPALWTALGKTARPVGTPVWRWLDVDAGVPLISAATSEAFVPQMANFDKIGGVSFHKGCYPGQEIVARTQYLGKVKRHLYRIHTDHALSAGNALFSPENPEHPSGMVASAAPAPGGGYDALAVIQDEFIAAVELGAPGGPRVMVAATPVP